MTHSPSIPSLSYSGVQIPQIFPTRPPLLPSKLSHPKLPQPIPPNLFWFKGVYTPPCLCSMSSLDPLGLCRACVAPAPGVPRAPSPSLPAAEGLPCLIVTSRPLLVQTAAANHRHICQNLGLPGKALFLKALYNHPCEYCRQQLSASCRAPWSNGNGVRLGETPRDAHFFLQLALAPVASVQLEDHGVHKTYYFISWPPVSAPSPTYKSQVISLCSRLPSPVFSSGTCPACPLFVFFLGEHCHHGNSCVRQTNTQP